MTVLGLCRDDKWIREISTEDSLGIILRTPFLLISYIYIYMAYIYICITCMARKGLVGTTGVKEFRFRDREAKSEGFQLWVLELYG